MSDPKTKTVLRRVFTRNKFDGDWELRTTHGTLVLFVSQTGGHAAMLLSKSLRFEIASAHGPTESDAILALQSTLRKMALLEVAE